MSINKILFPTDFSLHSGNALYYTINLAARLKADVLLLHCYQYPSIATDVPAIHWQEELLDIEKKSHHHMAEVIEYASHINPSVHFESYIYHDDIIDNIKKFIKEKEIDLIMMYTKGANAIKEFLYDTNAAKIVENASCPVIVIPENYSFTELTNILYLSDFLDSDATNIQYLTSIAKPFESKIHVVNITKKENEQNSIFKNFEVEVRKVVSYEHLEFLCLEGTIIYQYILNYTQKQNIDLIVMSTRHRHVLEKIYDHSLTKKITYHSKIPILAFHATSMYEEL